MQKTAPANTNSQFLLRIISDRKASNALHCYTSQGEEEDEDEDEEEEEEPNKLGWVQ